MASMITCVACRKQFASNIENCPNCGLPKAASIGQPAVPPVPTVTAPAPRVPPPYRGVSPGHGDGWCLSTVTAVYGSVALAGMGGGSSVPLEPSEDFWLITQGLDRWFEDSPQSKEVDQSASVAYDAALRMLPCGG